MIERRYPSRFCVLAATAAITILLAGSTQQHVAATTTQSATPTATQLTSTIPDVATAAGRTSSESSSRSLLLETASGQRGGGILSRGGESEAETSTTTETGRSELAEGMLERLKVGFYFGLWYALNIIYNILNKKLLNVLPAPLTVGSVQLGVGCLYVALLWLLRLRPRPILTKPKGQNALRSVGLWHAVGQQCSMVSLGAGPVSFTHIVKALEPFFSAAVSALCFGKWMKPQVYATLIPVVGGVGYACLKERSFSWLAFVTAMMSNVAFALRAVLSKVAMTEKDQVGTFLSPPNTFAVVTIASFYFSIPMALIGEGKTFQSLWKTAKKTMSVTDLCKAAVVSGLFHYLNNEVMYLALGSVHPVTLAVGNTMKRVFIMVASVMVFRNEITVQAAIGSAIGISGVLLYSLTKQYYEKLEAKEAAETLEAAEQEKERQQEEIPRLRRTLRVVRVFNPKGKES